MNKEQLQQKIKKIEQQLEYMKKQLEKKQYKSFPQLGDLYWFYAPNGDISSNTSNGRPNYTLEIYKTKEEAEKAYKISCAKKKLKDRIEELNDGWVPDWNNDDMRKFSFYFYNKKKYIGIDCRYSDKYYPNWLYMKSREIAKQILSEMEEVLKLIFSE